MTILIRNLTVDDEPKWDDFVEQSSASFYHLAKWRHLIKKVFGHSSHYLYAVDDAEIIKGILPLIRLKSHLFGDFLVSMPYFNYGGAIAVDEGVELKLMLEAEKLGQQLGCSHIEYRDVKQRNTELPVRTDKVSMILQLPSEPDLLWNAIGSKRRAQVKRPMRERIEFITGGIELLDDFYHAFSINMRDLGTPVYSRSFFKEMLVQFEANTIIAVARMNDEAVSAGFLVGHNQRLEIPWASTLRKVNKYGVNMYLYWNILSYAIKNKYTEFDFGRSSKDAGTLKFKKQWGGEKHQLYWYYQLHKTKQIPGLNPSNRKFQLAIAAWQKLPVFIANIIGPVIVRNLP